ncbi:hypothetical protein G7075_13795 [Phycicoccus sp. HDW14]|uniref:hypothetical protein n=1 Tax=Phycicoccus sp. HDW14 TaxID=2714941 RepID=UPI001409CA54|nr:hypothetical protein [Phycicoccus sp. HDW14]QIM21953.1 hypothetical protein G7075_13795 [Phycicoccus sp. HDW14]
MTHDQQPGPYGGAGAHGAPPQLPPPAHAYASTAVATTPAGPITPVQEQTSTGLQVRWDGTVLAPSSVMNAVYLMWAGAALALVTGIISMLGADSAVEGVLESTAMVVDPGLRQAMVTGVKVVIVVWALVETTLWMWMASANGKGRGSARIIASVFYGFLLLGLLGGALRALTGGLPDLLLALPSFAVGTAALVLLWLPASSRFYATVRNQRR